MAFPDARVPMTAEALDFAEAFATNDAETGYELLASLTSVQARAAFAANLAALAVHLAGSHDDLLDRLQAIRAQMAGEQP